MLKSWAIPKGPSLAPTVKRLAIEVEDHRLGYATFEGTIPKGQYGAGTVTIWDRGTYENLTPGRSVTEGMKAGRIEFVMHGEHLRGRFALVRMGARGKSKPQWLLLKAADEFAVSEE